MSNIKVKFLKHQKTVKTKTHVKDKKMIDKEMSIPATSIYDNRPVSQVMFFIFLLV
jgi:hypothetical protein